jgi:hypothetical protein
MWEFFDMKMVTRLAPSEYRGQMLCPRCGDDGTGHGYFICADRGSSYSHAESCALYTYGTTCEQCDQEMEKEMADEYWAAVNKPLTPEQRQKIVQLRESLRPGDE